MAWKMIESNGDWTGRMHRATYMIDNESDIRTPPPENETLEAGSIAYTPDMTSMYQKDSGGNWVKVGG